jgi:ABC-2 type transport system ATP-binding protein
VGAGAPLRDTGVTIILTTHYIEEAEEMADRIGVIRKGELILVEDKATLMRKLGKQAAAPAAAAAAASACRRRWPSVLELVGDGTS